MNNLQPRIRGSAYQKKDRTWTWEAVITIGDMEMDDPEAIVVNYGEGSFLNKESAIDRKQRQHQAKRHQGKKEKKA